VAADDNFEPIPRLFSAVISGVAAETVPYKGKPGILRIRTVDSMLVPLS